MNRQISLFCLCADLIELPSVAGGFCHIGHDIHQMEASVRTADHSADLALRQFVDISAHKEARRRMIHFKTGGIRPALHRHIEAGDLPSRHGIGDLRMHLVEAVLIGAVYDRLITSFGDDRLLFVLVIEISRPVVIQAVYMMRPVVEPRHSSGVRTAVIHLLNPARSFRIRWDPPRRFPPACKSPPG